MPPSLTWGLTVCTYNRPHFLVECLKHVLNQTRLPNEVVVVDASDYWQDTLAKVQALYGDYWETINLVYRPADVRSLPHQRNQALDLSQSDIVFSLDDDIYLFPETADIVMNAYEIDKAEEIAMIGCHFVDSNPGESDSDETISAPVNGEEKTGLLGKIKASLESRLSLDSHFVPYGKPVIKTALPASLKESDIVAGGLINGGRTTFRRRLAEKVRWSTLLRYYATHEDSDFSYRMSLMGRLAVAVKARLFHADGNERPFNRFKVNVIRVYNLMALHRFHSRNKIRSGWLLMISFVSFAAMYLLIDFAQKRFTFPVVRAYLLGLALIPFFMFFPFKDFHSWYVKLQEKMYRG